MNVFLSKRELTFPSLGKLLQKCCDLTLMALTREKKPRVVQYSQIDSIGVSGDKKGVHWYQW